MLGSSHAKLKSPQAYHTHRMFSAYFTLMRTVIWLYPPFVSYQLASAVSSRRSSRVTFHNSYLDQLVVRDFPTLCYHVDSGILGWKFWTVV